MSTDYLEIHLSTLFRSPTFLEGPAEHQPALQELPVTDRPCVVTGDHPASFSVGVTRVCTACGELMDIPQPPRDPERYQYLALLERVREGLRKL